MISELEDVRIMTIILNKDKVYVDLRSQKNYLYNYTANLLLEKLHNKKLIDSNEVIDLVVDRKDTKKSIRENFINYLTKSMKSRRDGDFKVALHASYESKALQAVDFISWSIFQKYEHGDFEYYEIIKNKIIKESVLFP